MPSVKKNNTRQKSSLPSVKKTLGKEALCRVSKKNTRQRRLCRVPEKQHLANHLALGKEPVSDSAMCISKVKSLHLPIILVQHRAVLNKHESSPFLKPKDSRNNKHYQTLLMGFFFHMLNHYPRSGHHCRFKTPHSLADFEPTVAYRQ